MADQDFDERELMGRAVMAFMKEGDSRLQANRRAGSYIKFYKKQKKSNDFSIGKNKPDNTQS